MTTWTSASTPPARELCAHNGRLYSVLGCTVAGHMEVVHYSHETQTWISMSGLVPVAYWTELPEAPNPWLWAEAQPAERGDCTPEVAGSTPAGSTIPTDSDFRRAARRNLAYRRRVPGAGALREMQGKE